MADYLEEAARALRAAERKVSKYTTPADEREVMFRVADGFTRLAAIERGLLPPETGPADGDADRGET